MEQPPIIKTSRLSEMKELTKEGQAGLLTIMLNDEIQALLANELNYRVLSEMVAQDASQRNLAGMEKTRKWVEANKKQIKIIREFIKEIENGKYKI